MTCKLQVYNMFTYLMLYKSSLQINSEILIIDFTTSMLHCWKTKLVFDFEFCYFTKTPYLTCLHVAAIVDLWKNFFNDSISTFLFKKEFLPRLFNSLDWIWLGWATRWSIRAILPYQNSANVILRVRYAASFRKYSASRINSEIYCSQSSHV